MRQQYDANPWGWNAAGKRSELAHDDARFVLVRGGDGSGSIQAFAHFRFDVIFDWERYEARTRTREALPTQTNLRLC